jgi:hypothetical protein
MAEKKMDKVGKQYWLDKCKAADNFLVKKDYSTKAFQAFMLTQTIHPICYATDDITAWDDIYRSYTTCVRALAWFLGEKVYLSDESRLLRCAKCKNFTVCPSDPKEKMKLCVQTMTEIAKEFQDIAKSI